MTTFYTNEIDYNILSNSLKVVSLRRGTLDQIEDYKNILQDISQESIIQTSWIKFQNTYGYAKDIDFNDTVSSIKGTFDKIFRYKINHE